MRAKCDRLVVTIAGDVIERSDDRQGLFQTWRTDYLS